MRMMRDSGMPWIGEIPLSWTVDKVKGCLRRHEVKGYGNATVLSLYRDYGVVPKDSRDDNYNRTGKNTNDYKLVRKGDLVINKMKAWQGSLAVSRFEGIVSPAYFIYEFLPGMLDRDYAGYLLRFAYRQEFDRVSGGIREGQWDLPAYEFEHMPILLPPSEEQRRIADYLNERCGAIDEAKKVIEAEVDALKRLKKATILKAVTKGLDDNVPMRDSGIDWIGLMPCHWNFCKQKHAMKLINGRAYASDEFELDGKYRILRVGNLFSNPDWYTSSLELPGDKYCEEGDLLYSWSMSYGPHIWHGEKVIYHYHIWKAKLSNRLLKRFAYYYLLALTDAIQAEVHETTMGFLTMETMNNSYIALPSIGEQEAVADYLDERCAAIDSIIEARTKQLERLEDYRKALIYAYATGKKEVPAS